MSWLTMLPWGKIFGLAVDLIGRAVQHSDDLKELEREWLKFTRSINKKIPVKYSDEQKMALEKLDELERQEEAKVNHLKQQLGNYKAKHEEVYKRYLKLQDDTQKKSL